ncbi:hypothetical protein WN55_08715 [Dufourea novaeangliae]|uniref:Uncharacterized protein n=1 Tax=Dufourea novaeangliae TaxID=178035 RepID=A0A154P1J7_DUFNO|nr:hypothetical protein WN55_08715 [Dufourea novaeangliae]
MFFPMVETKLNYGIQSVRLTIGDFTYDDLLHTHLYLDKQYLKTVAYEGFQNYVV